MGGLKNSDTISYLDGWAQEPWDCIIPGWIGSRTPRLYHTWMDGLKNPEALSYLDGWAQEPWGCIIPGWTGSRCEYMGGTLSFLVRALCSLAGYLTSFSLPLRLKYTRGDWLEARREKPLTRVGLVLWKQHRQLLPTHPAESSNLQKTVIQYNIKRYKKKTWWCMLVSYSWWTQNRIKNITQ